MHLLLTHNLPIDRAIMGFSGLGVSFIPSTMARMGLSVFLDISEGLTFHLGRLLFSLAGLTLTWVRTLKWCTPFPFIPLSWMSSFRAPFIFTTKDIFLVYSLFRKMTSKEWKIWHWKSNLKYVNEYLRINIFWVL